MIDLNKKGGWKRWKLIVLFLVILMSSFAFANLMLSDEEGLFKNSFKVGEPVIIKTEHPNDYSLTIVGENKIYRFFGEKEEVVKFIPDEKGKYKIIISGEDFNYEKEFSVVEDFVENYSVNYSNNYSDYVDSELILEIPQEYEEEILENEDIEVYENIEDSSIIEDFLFTDIQEQAIQQEVILGEPVKWTFDLSREKLSERLNVIMLLPESAENIVIKSKLSEDGVEDYFYEPEIEIAENRFVSNSIQENERILEDKIKITQDKLAEVEALKGKKAISLSKLKAQEVEQLADVLIVEYYTPAPEVFEQEIRTGKQVKISSPEGIHYENVLAYSSISESFNLKDASKIKIWWVEENKFIEPFSVQDKDNNGIYDYVEWFVPHLSTQTFNIIVITKADYLDENKNFISDISEQVKDLDGIWSEEILDGNYVRVVFEKELTSKNDITIYPKILSGKPKIEVYEYGKSEILTEFPLIESDTYNKVFLRNLIGSQDSFDLRIIGGSIIFDHIVDPESDYVVIQRNVTSFSSISTDIEINPVDTASSFVLLKSRSSNSGPNVLQVTGTLINSSVLRLERFLGTATDVSWEVVESNYFSVQRAEESYGTTDSNIIVEISEVDLNKSFVLVTNRLNTSTANQYVGGLWRATFLNSTAITFNRGTTGTAGVISWQVIEVTGANVSSGTSTLGSTITSINAPLGKTFNISNSFVILSKDISGATGLAYWNIYGSLTNSTNLQIARSAASGTVNVDWFVIQHPFFRVQRGSTSVSGNTAINQIISDVNTSNTFHSASWSSYTGTGTTNANAHLTSEITSSTNLQFLKGTNNQNQDVYWEVVEVSLDKEPPEVIIFSPNSTYYGPNNFPLIINFSVNEQVSSAIYTLNDWQDNSTINSIDGVFYNDSISSLSDGAYILRVYVEDEWANINDTESVSFNIDSLGPVITIEEPKSIYYSSGLEIPFKYNISDEGVGGVTCWMNFNGWFNETIVCYNDSTIDIVDGSYNITFYGNDSLGNINLESVFFVVDSVYPEIEIISPLPITYDNLSILLEMSASDNYLDTVWYEWNGTNETYFGPVNITFNEGSNIINAWANDSAGNTIYTNVSFFVDTTPPEFLGIPDGAELVYGSLWNGVTFYFDVGDVDAVFINDTVNFEINSSGFLNWTGYLNVSSYFVLVSINDSVGNVNSEVFNLNVSKKNLNITAENKTKTFGDVDPEFNASYEGFVLGENNESLSGVLSFTRQSGESAGQYFITPYGQTSDNYEINYVNGTLTIQQAVPVMNYYLNELTDNLTITYLQTVNASANTNGGTINIYRNGSLVTSENNQEVLLGAGSYVYEFNVTGNENYTDLESEFLFLTINKTNSSVYTYLNNSRENITIYEGSQIWLNATLIIGEGMISIFNNGTLINEGFSYLGNLTTFNDVGIYNITTIYQETQNYTYSFETWNVTVIPLPDSTPPNITIISPDDGVGSFIQSNFSYSVVDSSSIINCSLLINGLENSTQETVPNNLTQEFIVNLSVGVYDWQISCFDSSSNQGFSDIRKIHVFKGSGFDGDTTDLQTVNVSSIQGLILHKQGYGKIIFNQIINLSGGFDFDSNVRINYNNIFINSSNEPKLNVSANLSFEQINYVQPVSLFNGEICEDCVIQSYSGGIFNFSVPHFSNYSVAENTSLMIWDNNEQNSTLYNGSLTKYVNEEIIFFANYSNISSGEAITGAVCLINFNNSPEINYSMQYDSSNGVYYGNNTFVEQGEYLYNITCSAQNFATLKVSDSIYVQILNITPISQCGLINAPGKYVLTQEINSTGTCLTVNVDDVEIDCQGYTINYDTAGTNVRMGINAVDGTNPHNNLTVKNCVLVKPTNVGNSGYGIMLTRYSNSKLINNTIYTNGTTDNYGIYLTTNSQNNLIENNKIYSSGSSSGNAGLYILTGSSNNVLRNNNIYTYGTTTGYGIWISGVTTPSNNNTIYSNNISTAGTGANNYGIYLYRNVSHSNITANVILTSGTTTNHGIYGVGTTGLEVNNNTIESNRINVTGSAATITNYGVYISSNANNNAITNNTIYTFGTTANYGIYLLGTTTLTSNNNSIISNIIRTNGTTTNNYGIRISTNANGNVVEQNDIATSGTSGNDGIYLSGTATIPSNNNLILKNNIYASGSTTGNYGVLLITNANFNVVAYNSILAAGSSTNYGVYVNGDAFASVGNNVSFNNVSTLGTAASNFGIYLYRNVSYTSVVGNVVLTGGSTTNHGIYAVGTTGESVDYNVIDSNVVNASGNGVASSNYGVFISTNGNFNNVTNNNISTNGTTANYGIYLLGTTTLTSNNNSIISNIIRTNGTTTNNYGIRISTNANGNVVEQNDIATSGTSGNDGIYLSGTATIPSNNNLILKNNIYASGSTTGNYGVLLITNANFNVVAYNSILAAGSSTNYGVYVNGDAFASVGNNVSFNNVSTLGTAASNFGIYLYRNVSYTSVVGNVVLTGGSTTNHGIYAVGTTGESVDYNVIDSNVVNASGNGVASSNYGVFISTNGNFNNVTNNNISTNGTTANYGVHILGTTTLAANENVVSDNNINSIGTENNNIGVYIATNVNQNKIKNNNILSSGTSTNYGVHISGASFACTLNEITNNNIITSGSADSNYGIYFYINVNSNNVTQNFISTQGTTTNYGIYLIGTSALPLNSNIFDSNILNVTNADRINLNVGTWNTTFYNNSIINTDYSYYDIRMSVGGINQTSFINQFLENYSFTGVGGTINVKNTDFGEIIFLEPVNGNGTNFYNDIQISNNLAYVNSLQNGLNKSALVTLYNISTNYSDPVILRDYKYICNSTTYPPCYNFTSLNSGNVIFNVSSWSNYSIQERPPDLYPEFSNSEQYPPNNSPYVFNQNYFFSIKINNTNGTAGGEFDGVNYTLTNSSYNNFTMVINNLGAGTYSYYYWAYGNGFSNFYASSDIYYYTVARANPLINLTLDGSSSNITRTYGDSVELNCSTLLGDSNGILNLYINDYLINSGTGQISNITYFNNPGLFKINCNYSESQNYSSSSTEYWVDVLDATPAIQLFTPLNNSGDNDGNVTFIFGVTNSSAIENCSLFIDGILNQTNSSVNMSINQSFELNALNIGGYSWQISCFATGGLEGLSELNTLSVVYTLNFDGETTNLSNYDVSEISNFTLERTGLGKIVYIDGVNLSGGSDIDGNVIISNSSIFVNAINEPRLNKTATLYMYNLNYLYAPILLRDGEFCDNCVILNYSSGNLTFNVSHFTNYTTKENSVLNIWDDTDNESGYMVKYANDQILFYANYSNTTSGLPITGASCNISFLEYDAPMIYNSTQGLYLFNRSFNETMTYNWSVYCVGSPQGFESLYLSDEVTLQIPGVLNVTLISPNVNVNVSQNKFFNFSANITCNDGVCRNITAALDPISWWNSTWPYKIPFNLTVASGSTGPDFQFKLTLNSSNVGPGWNWSNECVSNNSRIRFVNGSENLELPYWIQNCSVSGQTMDVWIKSDTSITTSGTIVYLYYGNPTASLNSNGTATFDFFDDFSGDLSKWTRHITSGVYPRIESGYMVSGGGITSPPYGHTVLGSNATYTGFQNGIIEGTLQLTTNSIGEIGFRGIYGTDGYKSRVDARSGQGLSHLKPPYSGWGFLAGCTVSGSPPSINQWLPFTVIVSGTSFNISVASQTKVCTDSQYSSAGEISLQNHYGSYTWYDDIRVRKYFSLTPSVSFGSEEVVGVKGIVPENSGTPFYTINNNPRYSADLSCLNVLYEGESCSITWIVNATGNLYSYWNFFVTANYSTSNATFTGESKHINITIIDDTIPPSITNPQLNTSILNQTEFIRLNVTVTDESLLDFVTATILYPNSSSKNFSMSILTGYYYYLDFNDTLADGLYNITHIIAKDQAGNLNDSAFYNLSFNVTSDPPTAFNLTSPLNNSESSNLLPNLTWEPTQSTKFSNYTILISSDVNFNHVNFSYYNFNISNTSRIVDNPLNSNTIFYWRVIASNIYGTQTNSTQDFIYITDTLAPALVLNYPGNNNYVTSSNILLNYTPTETNTLTNCTLYGNFSGTWGPNETNISVIKNQANTFSLSLSDGSYLWNVLCSDAAGNSAYAVSNNTFKIDTNSPIINLMTPENDTVELVTNNVFFEANATDAMSNISSCKLVIDDVLRQTIYSVTNNVPFNFTEVVLNGNHTWNVNCTDTNGFEGSSVIYNISVNVIDTDPPLIDLNYPGESVHVSSNNLTFNFTPKDATGLENCSVYVDGVLNGSIFNPENFVPSYYTISNLSETTHTWQVHCYDNSTSNNFGVSNIKNFTVDLTNPTVILHTPLNDSFIPLFTAYFNFTPDDTNLASCSLYGNFSGTFAINKTITNPLNNIQNNFSLNLSDGIYLWNVYCNDSSGRGSFASQNFTVKVDINSPSYFNISEFPVTPANYSDGGIYSFNVTWIDNLQVSAVLFESNFSGMALNQSPVNVGNNVYGINFTNVLVGNYYYVWHANDTKNNRNKTNQQIYQVQKGVPNLSLQFNGTDSDITINQSESLNITADIILPSSGYLELFKDGVLINNGTSPLSNITYFYEPGYFNFTVVFLGDSNYTSYQKTNFVNVEDVTPPSISLISPENNSFVGTSLVNFQYIVYDSSNVLNCSLYLNDLLNQTNYSVMTSTPQTFSSNLSDGNYSWYIQCVDSYYNIGKSDTYNFTVFETSSLVVDVNVTKPIFQLGELVPVNVLTKDIFDNPIQSTANTAIIYTNTTNTDAVWWNGSWNYRLPISITENNNSDLSDYQLNISIDTANMISNGKMRSDCGDIRFADKDGLLIPHTLDSGCNTSSTIIWVKINVDANESKNIYLYYGNSTATHSNNASLVFDYYDSSDQISSWTTNGNAGQTFTQGLPSPSYYAASTNGYYMYKNIGLTNNKIVDFNVRSDGLGNFYFLVNSAGSGQHFRAETRAGNSAGVGSATSWTSWSIPSQSCANIATNTWYNFSLVIGSTTSQAYINGVTCGGPYTFANNGGYIGLIGDGLGGSFTTWWDNIRVRKYIQIIPSFNVSSSEEILVMMYVNQTDIVNGTLNFTFDSYDRNLGNYSVVTYAYTAGNQIGHNSAYFDLTPDTTPPNITLNYPNAEQIVGGPGNFNVTFNWSSFDYSRNSTCNLTIDSILNQSGIFLYSNSSANITVSGFTSGIHYWNVSCIDVYANTGYSETRNFSMDLTAPQITLNHPEQGFNTSNTSIIFNWTATDDFSENMSCKVFVDGVNLTGNITSINNVATSITLNNLNSGTHNWNVTCYDLVQNNNVSETRTYVLLGYPEDLYIQILPNQSVLINWTPLLEADTYNIYISENYSAGFHSSPNITGLTSTQYVDDEANITNRRFYRISSVRGIAETPGIYDVGIYSIQLYSGFNMISNPFLLKNYELKNDTNDGFKFNTDSDCLLSVWNYQSGSFERADWVSGSFYQASGSENFTHLNESDGYWLETNNSCILRFAGIVPKDNMTRSLSTSFNLVPWLSVEPRILSTNYEIPTITTIPENSITAINRFNASNQQFEVTIHYLISGTPWGWWPSFNNQYFTSLVPVEGYYFDSSTNAVWYHKP